ncbi:serine protease [Myxococcaceae bacterium GXIMD 01537]
MSRLSLLALSCLLLAPPAARAAAPEEPRPTRATLQKVLELHERSVVQVRGPKRSGPGVFVGSQGQVLTSVEHVSLDSGAEVKHGDQTLPAKVLAANGTLKFAVVAAPSGTYPAVPVRVQMGSPAGQWLIGVERSRGKRQMPRAAQARGAPAPFLDVDLILPPGSPLFDAQGRLVAVVVQRRGPGVRALPLEAVKTQLAAAGTP